MLLVTSCKKEKAVESAATPEQISMDTLSAVLGKAEGPSSGLFDFSQAEGQLRLVYHLYVPEGSDFNDFIGADMAPKIRKLYEHFKGLDGVTFVVETSKTSPAVDWTPYCSFGMTRKIFKETNWTGLLGRDLFKVCKEIVYSK